MDEFVVLPNKVDEWTLDTVVNIVRKYEFEPGVFDYKAVLHATSPEYRNEHNASIRRTVCSMANADGGFILFGIRDRNLPANSPDDRLVGIPLGGDLRKEFAEKISAIERPVYFEASPEPIVLPTDSMRGIFVVYIPQNPLRPHMDESTGNFYRRGEGGVAEIMKFYEVREQMMYTEERLRKLVLFRLKLAQYRKIALSMYTTSPVTKIFNRFDTGAFEVLLADICGLLPPSTRLLEQLLEISVMANVVNTIFARTTSEILSFAHDIVDNSSNIHSKCAECENQLNQIFGPLPGR